MEKKPLLGQVKHKRSTEVAFPPLKGWCNSTWVSPSEDWQNSKYLLLLTEEPEMKGYFLIIQENVIFVFSSTFLSIFFFQFLQF